MSILQKIKSELQRIKSELWEKSQDCEGKKRETGFHTMLTRFHMLTRGWGSFLWLCKKKFQAEGTFYLAFPRLTLEIPKGLQDKSLKWLLSDCYLQNIHRNQRKKERKSNMRLMIIEIFQTAAFFFWYRNPTLSLNICNLTHTDALAHSNSHYCSRNDECLFVHVYYVITKLQRNSAGLMMMMMMMKWVILSQVTSSVV